MKKIRHFNNLTVAAAACVVLLLAACRGDDPSSSGTDHPTDGEELEEVRGFFLLNEGAMSHNRASIDYFDYETGSYEYNIFGARNPYEPKELGDIGNDIEIYGDKLYAVINGSNYLEVMDVNTAKHITKITIPNCRYVTFDKGYAYVSSYAGEIKIDENARIGYVAKIDTLSLKIVDECTVGYQPEQMAVAGNKLYVANSGGYRVPNYDTTVSVIDLDTFTVTKTIEVAINLYCMQLDNYGNLYVGSRGDYYDVPPKTYIIDTKTDMVTDELELLPSSSMALYGDMLYTIGIAHSKITEEDTITYSVLDTKTKKIVSRKFINDGTDKYIEKPYGLAINPENGDIIVTDAKDYVVEGTIYCFSKDGILKWSHEAGNIPAHIVFTTKKLLPADSGQ